MKTPPSFQVGQCWMSESEPELGIGFVKDQDLQSVTLSFPWVDQVRRYGKRTSPLRRLEFREGDTVTSNQGMRLLVVEVELRGPLLWYKGAEGEICESDLSPKLRLQRPLQRFLAGQWDPLRVYELRRETMEHRHDLQRSPSRGLIGPRVQLLPHQLYVVQQIASRGMPRALLADEVGLGKTIEAGWILHRLWVTGQVRRVLILAPGALVNQWFVELFRRFNLSFWVPESQEEFQGKDVADFERVILGIESLKRVSEEGGLEETEWDLIIVDEAHRIEWSTQGASAEYQILERLAARSRGLLLLTATPEQLGLEGHFSRLHLIDPSRFPNWESFQREHETYREVVPLADALLKSETLTAKVKKDLDEKLRGKVSEHILQRIDDPGCRQEALRALVDFYGTGRVYFRNARRVVELENVFFPRRHLREHPNDSLVRWLGDFAQAHRKEKIFLICSSAKKVIDLEKKLRDDYAVKVVSFHENQPLLVRDRNAAYFEDPEGASILLSSEIGGEGRNFQHAQHLVLADLPEDPDLLEQRIGRLDRIGQKADISIHVPYEAGSAEELLLRVHRDVFRAFEGPIQGARQTYDQYRAELSELLGQMSGKPSAKREKAIQSLIERMSQDYRETLQEIEKGRDRLIELNSFRAGEGSSLAEQVRKAERPEVLREYFERIFDAMGIHVEDLEAESFFVEPGDSMFVSYFPALPAEGRSMTYSRIKALARDDLSLMSWDHPMVTETLEALMSQEAGNAAVAVWKNARAAVLLECQFILEPVPTDSVWNAAEYFPPVPIRVVLDPKGADVSAAWGLKALRDEIVPLPKEKSDLPRKVPPDALRSLLAQARKHAEGLSISPRDEAVQEMERGIGSEILRLRAFQAKNQMVNEREIEWWQKREEIFREAFSKARVRLDSFLLVLPG